jgi:uncharacterized protein (TIGR03435 family)
VRIPRAFKDMLILEIILGLSFLSGAQKQSGNIFDVSSVKPARSNDGQGSIRHLDPSTVSVASMTVYDMIELFYYLRPYQLSGGPDWSRQDRFDVVGKNSTVGTVGRLRGDAPAATLAAEYEQMHHLLEDRFRLELRHEVRALPTLMLFADKKRKFSPVPCSSTYTLQHGVVKGAIRIASLIALIQTDYDMPVSDGTGLSGCYYIETQWTTDPNNDSVPSIETSLHDLGFGIKRVTGHVDVTIIAHVERPQTD